MIHTDSFKIQKVQALSLKAEILEDFYLTAVEQSPNGRIMYVGLVEKMSKPINERESKIAAFDTKEFQLIS